MQVSVESPSNLGRKLVINVPSDQIENAVSDRVKELAKKVKLDGFRPGKVPLKVVEQRFGRGIREEVARDLLQSSLFQAIQENNLKPAGTPSVEPGEIIAGKDFEFTATFEIFPEVTLSELDGVEVEQYKAELTDADVDGMIEKLREQNKIWTEVDRAAEQGDKVKIDFDGYKDGEPFEGGKAEDFDLELGSGSMIPGFEDQIVSLKAGDESEIDVTFPEDYGHKDLAGQAVKFKIKLHSVSESALPEINEDFVKQFNVEEGGVEAFKKDVKENMTRELERALLSQNKDKVFEAFITKNACDLPQALVDGEIENLKKDMMQRVFGNQKIDASKLPPLPNDMFEEQAKKRVHLGLIFAEYVKHHDVKPDADRVEAWLEKISKSYDKPQELLDWYRGSKERMAEVESAVLEEQAVEKMLESASIITVEKDYESIMNPKPAEKEQEEQQTEGKEEQGE